jgi:hypothetical protein
VEQAIEPAELLAQSFHQVEIGGALGLGEIEYGDGRLRMPVANDLIVKAFELAHRAPQQNDDGAVSGESERCRAPDAVAGPGHQDHPAVQQVGARAVRPRINAGHRPVRQRAQ